MTEASDETIAAGNVISSDPAADSEVAPGTEVAYVNPVYIQYAYRLESDMSPVYSALKEALGSMETFGSKKGLKAKKLNKYNYMPMMQKFDDPSELGEFASFEDATAAVEAGLAVEGDALTQVYRIDIPGKDQAVFGVAMKATQQNNMAARIMGIRTNRILMITWGISSFVGCVAGLLISPTTMQPFMMWDPLLKGFAAAVMGGMTSLPGAVVAAYLLGIIENLFGGYVSIEFKSSVAFAIIVLVLCIKPSGLFARHYVKKV